MVWYMQCSWRQNADTRFRISTVCGTVCHTLFSRSTVCGMVDICSAKGEWMEHGIEAHDVRDINNVQVHFRLGEEPMGHTKLLLSKGGLLIRGEVG